MAGNLDWAEHRYGGTKIGPYTSLLKLGTKYYNLLSAILTKDKNEQAGIAPILVSHKNGLKSLI